MAGKQKTGSEFQWWEVWEKRLLENKNCTKVFEIITLNEIALTTNCMLAKYTINIHRGNETVPLLLIPLL